MADLQEIGAAREAQRLARFVEAFGAALEAGTAVKLVLAKPQGAEADLEKVLVRPVTIRGEAHLAFVFHHTTKDVTRNLPRAKGLAEVAEGLGKTYRAAHLLLVEGELHLEWNRKGECTLRRGKGQGREAPSLEPNREKQRLLDPSRPWLRALGLMDARGVALPTMAHKWKQVNRFLEVFGGAVERSGLGAMEAPRVLDFGAGKGYLTFAVYDYLKGLGKTQAKVVGVELRPALVELCNREAARLGAGLSFRVGGLEGQAPEAVDVLIALHACDTATDLAINLGIRGGAQVILCSPCCHKELRPQLQLPPVLEPLLRHGIHAAQQAEMLTDTMRALLLEAHGYEVQVFEFISLEHTDKNKMILATKHPSGTGRRAAAAELAALKEFFGIRRQTLEELLAK
jgi:SAM-dependent methyltransferase